MIQMKLRRPINAALAACGALLLLPSIEHVQAQEKPRCIPGKNCSPPLQNAWELEQCLKSAFAGAPVKRNGVPAVTFPEDGSDYDAARTVWRGNNYPAAVVYARSVEQVRDAVNCATANGYRVSARGHGHSGQGFAVVSGYVVVDVSLMCTPDSFVVDRTRNGEHILPGSRYLATVKVSAGCTNAAVIAALHTNFEPSERALAVTGGWMSVGVGGFTLGGGSGDLTPYAGYGIDVLTAVDMVLADGTNVTATADNDYSDLFWACQGGGGGLGVVTHYTYKVIENPDEEGRVTRLKIRYNLTDAAAREELASQLQHFLYREDVVKTARYGGSMSFNPPTIECLVPAMCSFIELNFLGGHEDALQGLRDVDLLDNPKIPLESMGPSELTRDLAKVCEGEDCVSSGLPATGVWMNSGVGLAEGYFYTACPSMNLPGLIGSSGYVCDDLGIDAAEYCETNDDDQVDPGNGVISSLVCYTSSAFASKGSDYPANLVAELIEAAQDPDSSMNSVGITRKYVADLAEKNLEVPGPILKKHTNSHGLLVPELKDETMTKLATYGMFITHFQHGAAFEVADDATALPWRNAGIMMSNVHPVDGLAFVIDDQVGIISEEDPNKVQGYYNTIGPLGTPDWQRLYFGNNYERLTQIKAKYDAGEVFSKPMGVELPKQGEYCPTIPPTGGSATNGDDGAKGGDGSGADSRSSAPRASAVAAGGFLFSISIVFSFFFVVAMN